MMTIINTSVRDAGELPYSLYQRLGSRGRKAAQEDS